MEAIRPAAPDDAERFLELSWGFLHSVVSQRGGALLLSQSDHPLSGVFNFARFHEIVADTHRRVLVGTIDDVVMGLCLGHVERLGDGTRLGHFDGCYVEEGAREVGLGRLLIDSLTDWLDGQGCGGVDGVVLPGDRDAKGFYEAAGYKARLLIMHRPFG